MLLPVILLFINTKSLTVWVDASPPSPPVKPTYSELPPTICARLTPVYVWLHVAEVARSVNCAVRLDEPL